MRVDSDSRRYFNGFGSAGRVERGHLVARVPLNYLVGGLIVQAAYQCLMGINRARLGIDNRLKCEGKVPGIHAI